MARCLLLRTQPHFHRALQVHDVLNLTLITVWHPTNALAQSIVSIPADRASCEIQAAAEL